MSISINIEVENCEQCPYHESTKVYTPDSLENVRKVYCWELRKDVYKYLDWNEKAIIPKDCPYLSGEGL